MKKNKIVEAWRKEEYYQSLTEEERADLPAHPSGQTVVADEILRSVTGGCCTYYTSGCCTWCGNIPCF